MKNYIWDVLIYNENGKSNDITMANQSHYFMAYFGILVFFCLFYLNLLIVSRKNELDSI